MATSQISQPQTGDPPAMTPRQRLIAVLLLGTNFMLSVDFSILNIALPEVGRAVGLDLVSLPWVATAFALPAAGLSLLFGRLADLYGRHLLFLLGLALLAASSLMGGLATGPVTLLAARALQGAATAMTAPAALSLLITTFADERQRARVLGLNGALLSAGFTVGALAGGLLVGALSWHWTFLINVPFALVILALAPFVIPTAHTPEDVKLDVPGAITITLALFAIVFGITERSLPVLIVGVILLALFFWIERRAKAPLVAMEMLALPSVRWGNLALLIVFAMEAGLIFLVTLYLQDTLHFGALTTGLIFCAPGLAAVAAGVIAGRIIARRGARPVLLVAMVAQAVFTAPLIMLGDSPSWLWLLIPALFIGFFGHITAVVAATVAATSEVTDENEGLATGLLSMTQQVAVTVGIPILGAVMALRADILAGIRIALVADVILTLAVVFLVAVGLKQMRTASFTSSAAE